MLIKLGPPSEEQEPTVDLKERITAITNYLVYYIFVRDLVGLSIRNTGNVQDNVVGIGFQRRDQHKHDVVWGVLGKVVLSNAIFGLSDRFEVHIERVRMLSRSSQRDEKKKGRSLGEKSEIKKSVVMAAFLCLAHAFIIALSKVNGNPMYALCRKGKVLKTS